MGQTFPGCNDARRRDASASRRRRDRGRWWRRGEGDTASRGGFVLLGATSEPARLSQSRLGVVRFDGSRRSPVPGGGCAPPAVVARTRRDYALSARGRTEIAYARLYADETFGISLKGRLSDAERDVEKARGFGAISYAITGSVYSLPPSRISRRLPVD